MLATDKRKDSFLKNRGWALFRFKEHELKRDPYTGIEMIRNIQEKRRQANLLKIKQSFWKGNLKVRSMIEGKMDWVPMSDIMRHNTPHKKMFRVMTEIGSVTVTEDHSLFDLENNPIQSSVLKTGDSVIGLPRKEFEPIKVLSCEEVPPELHTYDISVPGTEKFVLESGILAHNSYSISGVSLDIEKSSKYQAMKEEFMNQYDKLVEAAKRSIKIIKGLKQNKYGVGLQSALGPMSRPGVQSRRNFISSGAPSWS